MFVYLLEGLSQIEMYILSKHFLRHRNIFFRIKKIYIGSNIRVGSPGNFEAKLRLSRQNRNALVNLPRLILSHFLTRITDFSQVTETDIDLPRQNSRTLVKVPRQNFGLCYTLYICTVLRSRDGHT